MTDNEEPTLAEAIERFAAMLVPGADMVPIYRAEADMLRALVREMTSLNQKLDRIEQQAKIGSDFARNLGKEIGRQ
jgi:2-methylisocitrate lyase-like PEP mutase family enzyme